MPILIFRHARTDKNAGIIDADTPETGINNEGLLQGIQSGFLIRDFCLSEEIERVQPIVSGYIDEDGYLKPFARTFDSASLLLKPLTDLRKPGITINAAIPELRIADIKFKKVGTESGPERMFSDRRELIEETVQGVMQRVDGFYMDYLAEPPDEKTLLMIVCHTTVARLLAARHMNESIEFVEKEVKALYNMQGLEFHPVGVFTTFDGFAPPMEKSAQKHPDRKAGPFNLIKKIK